MCLHQVYVPEQWFHPARGDTLEELQAFFFPKAEFKAKETKFLRDMSHQVSQHGKFTFTLLYHWWNMSMTLLLCYLSYMLS